MRISDWSSDVCSSDLNYATRLLRERFEPAATLDVAAARSAPGVLAAHQIAGGATYDGLVALAALSAGLPLASRDRRASSTYRRLGVPVEMLGRSEEHTSELQSLMRISYAVFCLKKTKKI